MNSLPPWNKETQIFEQPDATCELVLDGQKRSVSVALWEGYCYLQVADLNGVWAITRPYDDTDLAKFIAGQIQKSEVGRVWEFPYTFSNWDDLTQKFTLPNGIGTLATTQLVAVVRFDNSAIVREKVESPFFETPPFSKRKRYKFKPTKANIPSVWHPARQLIERRRIGKAARPLVHRLIPQQTLFKWKKGSLPEFVALMEALYSYGIINKYQSRYEKFAYFPWPLDKKDLKLPYPLQSKPKVNLIRFLEILWEEHHFDANNWLPANHAYYGSISNRRYEWEKVANNPYLMLRNYNSISAHERLEAALNLESFFKGKISDEKLDELLREGPQKPSI